MTLLHPGMDYSKPTTPGTYLCEDCGAHGVKLWRKYQTFLEGQTLRCRACAEADQQRKLLPDSDHIGWLVPAVPTHEGDTYWGCFSIPQEGVDWWNSLPEEPPL